MNLGQLTSTHKSSDMGFVGFNLEGEIVYYSKKLAQILNLDHDSVSNVHDLFSRYNILIDAAVEAVQGVTNKNEIVINDRHYLVEMITHSPLVQDADIVAIFTDITEIISRQDSLKEEIRKTRELNKELEQFAYVTSHDLNEPLRMVSNFAQLLDSEYAESLDNDAKTYLQFVVDGSQRVQYLINDLLSYNRACRADLKPQLIQPEDVILLQAYKLKESIETKNAIVNIESSEEIFADPKWLGEVFHHIIKNAIVYNQNNPPEIEVSIDTVEDETVITVQDNGIGIEEKYKESIFQLLKKVDSRPDLEGSGIGLAICKKIISLHGGKLWFESELGKGSKFIFTLPKAQ